MNESIKQQSNSFSTGGGGVNFETRVQAAFTVLMLTGRVTPCIQSFPITRIKLQGRYAGFNTDDFIVFAKQPYTEHEEKLFAQIKHDISIPAGDETLSEVIHNAWKDFNGDNFDLATDAFALITGPLSATDIRNVRPVLEWARQSENEEEFLLKLNTIKFSSNEKRTKVEVFRTHLKSANNGIDVSDMQLWSFLKVFHVIGYDLDVESGSTLSLLHSLISLYSHEAAPLVWTRILDAVQTVNQNAGTITLETLPEDIRTTFNTITSSHWALDVSRLKKHGDYILDGIKTTVGGIHIPSTNDIAHLTELAELSSFVLVSGARGSGKSSLVRTFAEQLRDKLPMFCLRTEDLDKPHLDNVFSAMGLNGSLNEIEAGFVLMPKKILIIESLEKLLELENTLAFTDLLQLLKKQQGWTVIATCRDYAYQLLVFGFLQPSGMAFETLILSGFNDEQVQDLCRQLTPLQVLADNTSLKPLLKSPFLADLACRVLETGTEFTPEDGEEEFRTAVWRDVIAKEQVRANGMPLKRKRTFIDIAVKRARHMVYGVPQTDFDNEAILVLEEDDLVRRDSKKSLVSPAHDVLEDWAIDQYIDDAYQKHQENLQRFLDVVGHEPAMSRAFRLWLHRKLRNNETINDLVLSILKKQAISRYWQDETIAAVLQGDNPDRFLELLAEQLFEEDGDLLKRFCFILRIACQIPDQTVVLPSKDSGLDQQVNALFLQPYGKGWDATINFVYKNKHSLSATLIPHIIAVLSDWTTVLSVNEALPHLSRVVGLLALHLLNDIKDSYKDNGDRKKLISIILKTSSAIRNDFDQLLETDVFIARTSRRQHRLHYVDELCDMALTGVESAFICKYDPDTLMRLARSEWFVQTNVEDNEPWYSSHIDVAECFGLHEHRHDFSPPSGLRAPFRNLLYSHPRKGLDFILDLLNTAANTYAHSDLDHPRQGSSPITGYAEPLIEQVNIGLNDGTFVKQYCSGRLWLAYRGHSGVPYLLQSALMALENWLIEWAEQDNSNTLGWLFDYILRNSNSVMPTAVLASVATGFYEKIGKAALPLIQVPELYFLDNNRFINERAEGELNWFGIGRQEVLSEMYAEERRTAALRPWRKETIERLVVRLQFSEWREETLATIDTLRSVAPDSESMRFLLHRIDSRGWRPVVDEENNRIIFEAENLEPDLEELQQKTQEEFRSTNRFLVLFLWADAIFKREPLPRNYYASWNGALAEAKALYEEVTAAVAGDVAKMHYSGLVIAAAGFMRDHSSELSEEDIDWCANIIIPMVLSNADNIDSETVSGISDLDGATAAANTLPIFLDFAFQEDEIVMVKTLVVTALTHVNEQVRCQAANGVREHLWQRDSEFAQQCISGMLAYAQLEKESFSQRRQFYFLEDEAKEATRIKLIEQRGEFRQQIVHGLLNYHLVPVTIETHSVSHLLTSCLIIPIGSRRAEHVELLSQMINIFFEAEQEKHKSRYERDDDVEMDYKVPRNFSYHFAKHLLHLHGSGFVDYIEQLRDGCEHAPSFVEYLVLCVAVEAEQQGNKEVYWQLWESLSQKVLSMAIEDAKRNFDNRSQDDRRDFIRSMLKSDVTWQKVDFENQDIILGKDLLLKFADKAGRNLDVFEAIAKLIYYFPSIFFETGIHILAKHQKEEGGNRLLMGINTSFYLERSIQRFLVNQTGSLPRRMHTSCLTLLDAVVETASSRAYYLREHLIRSRRIL